MSPDDLYTPFEQRVRRHAQAEYGSPEHRQLVLALAECLDLVLPQWHRKETTPASCARAARRFGEGKAQRAINVRRLWTRAFELQRNTDYDADRKSYRLLGAALDVLSVLDNPLAATNAADSLRGAYVEAMMPTLPETGDEVEDLAASVRAHGVLAASFEAKCLAIFDRIFSVETP